MKRTKAGSKVPIGAETPHRVIPLAQNRPIYGIWSALATK